MGCCASSSPNSDPVEPFQEHAHSEIDLRISTPPMVTIDEVADNVAEVGGSRDMPNHEELHKVMKEGRNEIKKAQEKLSSSLTTPIVDSEAKVIESGSWLNELKDVNRRYDPLPPICEGKKIKSSGAMAFTVD